MPQSGRIVQISVSAGGVPKTAVPEAVVSTNGLEGDRQATPKIHGGPERAICLWSKEVIDGLQEAGHPIQPGSAGENITLSELDWEKIQPGVRLKLGDRTVLEVTEYAAPCRQNAKWFSDRRYSRISHRKHPGSSRVYARVIVGGSIRQGDPADILAD